jgi:type I restriction enzyme M protein
MDPLARFYTEQSISSLLIDSLNVSSPRVILDLGIGEGSLTRAAYKKWSKANFFGIDIDTERIKKTLHELPYVTIKTANGVDNNIISKLNIKVGSVDVAVCNPPYLKIKKDKKYDNLFKNAQLHNCHKLKYYTSDLIFLAHNLRILKPCGVLGIILPDGLLTGQDFKLFRHDLLTNHTIKSIIQLPDKIFNKTEARTHILIVQKGKKTNYKEVNLFLSDKNGICIDSQKVNTAHLLNRMDFTYHKWEREESTSNLTLGCINADIKRGSYSYKLLKDTNCNYFHTTTFQNKNVHSFKNNIYNSDKIVAQKGDILIARVGKRCIGKFSLVRSGRILISDCVYRVRVKKEYLPIVLKALESNKGREWFKVNSHGVCALVISKKDLLNFPLYK